MPDPNSGRASVLVVDDTAENLRLLTAMLTDNGCEVRPVTSGRHALQAADRAAPDLILLDINMPEMDGYEVCRRLKANPRLRDIPVLFLTALTGTADKLQAFGVGGVDYIEKPFQLDEVLARVRVHVELRRAQTELQLSYERLRELEKTRDELVHMIVHDMRTPLLASLLHLSMIRKRCGEDAASRAPIDTIERMMRRMTGMANDLLDVSRMQEGKLPLELQPCDVLAVAREVAEGFTGGSPWSVVVVEEEAPVLAMCDPAVLRRVLENLVSNGLKHSPAGTVVQVSAASTDTSVRVRVRDNGRGIAPEARERIFEKFNAAPVPGTTTHSVGLGLAFCKLAVHAHGGRIGVEENEGGGSVFWFELPRAA